jgi:heme oxygenase
MWREFGAALTAFAVERETQDRIVENAIATFRRLRGWFQRVHVS